jgi:hypothetical protein
MYKAFIYLNRAAPKLDSTALQIRMSFRPERIVPRIIYIGRPGLINCLRELPAMQIDLIPQGVP